MFPRFQILLERIVKDVLASAVGEEAARGFAAEGLCGRRRQLFVSTALQHPEALGCRSGLTRPSQERGRPPIMGSVTRHLLPRPAFSLPETKASITGELGGVQKVFLCHHSTVTLPSDFISAAHRITAQAQGELPPRH